MDKLLIGVIANNTPEYDLMKKVWEKNADNCFNNIKVFFLYGGYEPNDNTNFKIEQNTKNTFNFYCNCKEIFENLLYKSLMFFEWVVANHSNYMVLRTNLSTLFKLDELFDLYKGFYKYKYFFGGTLCEGFLELKTLFSGTNLTFSMETLKLIVNNQTLLLQIPKNDDVVLSEFIIYNYHNIHQFYNIKRLDFTDILLFQYFTLNNLDDVLCYRFKSCNRLQDSKLMKEILDNNFDKQKILDKIIFNYTRYVKISFDFSELSNGIITLYNTIVNTSVVGDVREFKISLKLQLKAEFENPTKENFTLFRILQN